MSTRIWLVIALALGLAACGASAPLTARQVVERFQSSGIEITGTNEPSQSDGLPKVYTSRVFFTDKALGNKGGQVIVCVSADMCEAITGHFKAFADVVGPYIYKSTSGVTVVQLNSGFTPEQAKQYEDIVKSLP
jgi:hypothetical protein